MNYIQSGHIAQGTISWPCDGTIRAAHRYHYGPAMGPYITKELIDTVISKYCLPDHIIMDQDNAFMSSLMNYLFKKFDIEFITEKPFSQQSLQAEHGINSLSTILINSLFDSSNVA